MSSGSKKPNMTVTSRFLDERQPIASKVIRCPYPYPPPNRFPIARLSFRGPGPKLDFTSADLTHAIAVASLPDSILFLDTNVFTRELETEVWEALYTRRILITPRAWKELLPWLKSPFCNRSTRDRVIAAARNQVNRGKGISEVTTPNIEVLLGDESFNRQGYEYYMKLLALRKLTGPIVKSVLTKQLGRTPTDDQFFAEVHGKLAERGFRMAKKGLEVAASPNKLVDEEVVLSAVLTGIITGREVYILTRDADLLEQYFKLLTLMKEHYRAMLAADQYFVNHRSLPFQELPVENDRVHVPRFTGSSFLQCRTTDAEFNPLPQEFHFVNIHCLLLGGETSRLKLTFSTFCAETEMAKALQVKASTNGLTTDKFDGRNCTINTARFVPQNHEVIISIGKEMVMPVGKLGNIGISDFENTLFCNEVRTHISW